MNGINIIGPDCRPAIVSVGFFSENSRESAFTIVFTKDLHELGVERKYN